ncbi:MAG: hypothetical protein Q8P51_18210 [Ignavibacteria bacterium]|nr:hypothetical protein [Ignavibacteria bacterium]
MQTIHGIDKLGIVGILIARLNEYETATGKRPFVIRLGENHRRTYREEAQSFDQLWLRFVMKDEYRKVWNGATWERQPVTYPTTPE